MNNQIQKNMVRCPKCQQLVSENRLDKHLKKAHSPEAENKRLAEQIFRQREHEHKNRIVQCHVCKSKIKQRNLSKHLLEQHGVNTIPSLVMGESPQVSPLNRNSSAWLSRFGTDSSKISDDVFDRGLVVSGGAFGQGKKR